MSDPNELKGVAIVINAVEKNRIRLSNEFGRGLMPHPPRSRRGGKEMIDGRKNDEERDTDAKAPADEFFLDRQQRLGFHFAEFVT